MYYIDSACIDCAACVDVCPVSAISVLNTSICKDCKFWKSIDGVSGECHAQSPIPQVEKDTKNHNKASVAYVVVGSNNVACGQYELVTK